MNFFGKTNPDTLDATHASLSQAVRSGDAAALAQALSGVKPAAVNHVPPEKLPLLFLAVMNNSAECTRLLLGARAEVDLADASGATAAFLAARNDAARASGCSSARPPTQPRARVGRTPLYVAAQNDSRRCLGTLLARAPTPTSPRRAASRRCASACSAARRKWWRRCCAAAPTPTSRTRS